MNGYINLHRQILEWEWYDDTIVKCLFLHLILNASFKDSKWRGNEIKKGQLITSTLNLSKDLGFSRQQIRTALNKLQSTNEITIKSTNKFLLVTIANWEKYQSSENLSTNKSTNKISSEQPISNQQITNNQPHRNNVNKYKNIKIEEDSTASLLEFFNSLSFGKVEKMTDSRLEKIKLLKEKFTDEEIKEIFTKADKSDFLKGKNDRGWKANFDWIINSDNAMKILAGNYNNAQTKKEPINNFKGREYTDNDFEKIMQNLRSRQNEVI